MLEKNIFVNINTHTIYRHGNVRYIPALTGSYKKFIHSLPEIETVHFYPFDVNASWFFLELQKRFPPITASWVFWSYEFYQRPDIPGASLAWQQETGIFSRTLQALKKPVKKSLGKPVFDAELLNEGYKHLSYFYSFLPEDFQQVKKQFPDLKAQYRPFSFISIQQARGNRTWEDARSTEVMIGHSASVSLHHAEVIDILAKLELKNPFLFPLEYGDINYGREIKQYASTKLSGNLSFIEQRMDLPAYAQRLSKVGFAIFNFRWQEGLGNIMLLLWNGTKIFLRENSSAYIQFRKWGLVVFSIENDLDRQNLSTLLSTQDMLLNRERLEGLFSDQQVERYWRPLFNHVYND